LTASPGVWSGTPAPTFAYQWQRCNQSGSGCAPISGATGASYLAQRADVGMTLRALVTGANSAGSSAATSAATARVGGPPVEQSLPKVSGTARLGNLLTGSNGTWSGYPAPTSPIDGSVATHVVVSVRGFRGRPAAAIPSWRETWVRRCGSSWVQLSLRSRQPRSRRPRRWSAPVPPQLRPRSRARGPGVCRSPRRSTRRAAAHLATADRRRPGGHLEPGAVGVGELPRPDSGAAREPGDGDGHGRGLRACDHAWSLDAASDLGDQRISVSQSVNRRLLPAVAG
jgi:hypothetical protein